MSQSERAWCLAAPPADGSGIWPVPLLIQGTQRAVYTLKWSQLNQQGMQVHFCPSVWGFFVALQADKDALEQLANEFEIDFVSLSFTRSREDVTAARDYLDSLGMVHTKVGLGQDPGVDAGSTRTGGLARF